MPCHCPRCRQLHRALTSADAALRRPGVLPVAAGLTALFVLVPALVVGVPALLAVLVAAMAAGALAAGAVAVRPRLAEGADPLAPLAVERWLCDNDDDWPWWVLGGVSALVGLLLLTSPRIALPLFLVGGLVAAVPGIRRLLEGCGRLA